MRPARELITDVPWPHTPIPPRALPEARNRVAALLRGGIRLTSALDHRWLRLHLADALDRSELFHADELATRLTRLGALMLPPSHLRATDLPAPDGLISWAVPVSTIAPATTSGAPGRGGTSGPVPVSATSWTRHADRLQITSYRAFGSGLAQPTLQVVRNDIGWLLPTDHDQTPLHDIITARTTGAPLATLALLLRAGLLHADRSMVTRRTQAARRRPILWHLRAARPATAPRFSDAPPHSAQHADTTSTAAEADTAQPAR